MFGAYRPNLHAADLESFPGRELHDVVCVSAHEPPEPSWHHEPRPAADAAKRRQGQMIVVPMRDEDDVEVDVLDEMHDGLGVAVQKAQTIDEQRVSENADAIHLDKHGRVPEVSKMRSHRPSVMRA